jgi:zinc protease
MDPGLFNIEVTLNPGVAHAEAERVVYEEIEKLKTVEVGEAELRKAKNLINTQLVYQQDSALSIVRGLSEAEMVAGWRHYVDFPKLVEQVTPADLRRVVNEYFTEDNRTVGWFIPKPDEETLVEFPMEAEAEIEEELIEAAA